MPYRASIFRGLPAASGLLATAVAFAPAPAAPLGPAPGATMAYLSDWHSIQNLYSATNKNTFIVVDVATQQLYLFENGTLAAAWPVSTSSRGTGELQGSLETPLGAFEIVRKIGAGLPEFSILTRHGPTGGLVIPGDSPDSDAITTRILMLKGLEPGWNEGGDVDTFKRHIYIHGTADLAQLGEPASEGCVQMAPGAVLKLFRAVQPGTLVLIMPGTGNLRQIPGEG